MIARQNQYFVMLEEGTTLSLGSYERGSHACSKDVDDGDARRMNSWLGDTSEDEVHKFLERVVKGYNEESMEISKEKMKVEDDDHQFMIMKEGINFLQQICHFSKFQEQSLFEQSYRLSMQLEDMQYFFHIFLFSEQCFKEAEDSQRSEDQEMEVAIQFFCINL